MVEVTIIRHGQANTGARDEMSYDKLSDLGHQQARWLGETLRAQQPFDHLIAGSMRRQQETAQGMALPGLSMQIDPRLNELNYFGLAESMKQRNGVEIPDDLASFVAHVPQLLTRWQAGDMCDHLETYGEFRARCLDAVRDAARDHSRPVLVSSTGVIATLTAEALGLDMMMKTKVFLKVMNTSVHRFIWENDSLHLAQYGAVPHLDIPGREHARTYG